MKLKIVAIATLSFLGAGALFFTSCQRERDTDTSEGTETAMLERNSDNVIAITDQAATGTISQFKKSRSGCATITIDSISIPHSITIDFGTTNCLCLDGDNRRGKIIRTFTGKYKDVGSVHHITFDNYFVNDNQVKGYKTVTNNGLNANGNYNFTIDTKDTVIKANNAGTVTWQSTRNREYTAGFNTIVWGDDIYKITGSGSGVKTNGYTWSMNITNALTIDHSCKYGIIAGTVQIQPQGKALRTLDYGNGTCDNDATLTINNTVHAIKIK